MFVDRPNPLPLQLYQLGTDKLICHRALPSQPLNASIYYYWWLDVAEGETLLEVIPDNATDLVMSPDIEDFSILYWPTPEKISIPLTGPVVYVGVSFRTEAVSTLFGMDIASIKSLVPGKHTTESLAIQALVNGVQSLKHPTELANKLDNLLRDRLAKSPNYHSLTKALDINNVLTAMHASVGKAGMKEIASQFELSDRQFRRIMQSLFGFGPKKIQRIIRLQSSLRTLLNPGTLETEDGFYDGAHRIKEIRSLTGLTPGQIQHMAEIYNSLS
ncbi:MAG: AraC family transcriptional regulator [Cyanobacteria bacterium P01_D01_bin.105]